jgi:Uma2 family endonuclease
MGETDVHIDALLYLRQALRYFFHRDERTYVAGNLLFYYEEGDPKAVKAPDVFVVKGIAKHDRRIYKLWEERVSPCVVFEVTSRSTRVEDQGTKRALYERLGVGEYFLFDPREEYLAPPLQGFTLVGEHYEPMDPASDGTLRSDALNLILRPEGKLLRLVDPTSGNVLPTLQEAATRAEEAQTEVARLQAELARLRRGHHP